MMNSTMTERSLGGIKIAIQAPAVNHLLFDDDSLFFGLTNGSCSKEAEKILEVYEVVSGQAVNLNKPSITFGSRVSVAVKTNMRYIQGIHNDGGMGK